MTRLWAAAEARALGFGGGAIVTAATGIRSKRISEGQRDLDEIEAAPPTEKPREQRVRRPGAGRKPLTEKAPTLVEDLESRGSRGVTARCPNGVCQCTNWMSCAQI